MHHGEQPRKEGREDGKCATGIPLVAVAEREMDRERNGGSFPFLPCQRRSITVRLRAQRYRLLNSCSEYQIHFNNDLGSPSCHKVECVFPLRSCGAWITLPAGLSAIVSRLGLRAADVQPTCLRKSWQVLPLVWPNKFPHLKSRTEKCFFAPSFYI